MYTRKDYTNKISPYCLLPQGGYRPMTQSNRQKLNQFMTWGSEAVNFLKRGGVGAAHEMFSPRVLAEGMKQHGKRPVANTEFYNKIVNNSTSYSNGIQRARSATKNGRRYIIMRNGKNYMNFKQKLVAKHPRPFPENAFKTLWGQRQGNMNFIRRVKNYALNAGYTFPKEKIQALMAKRQTTRYGAARKTQIESERVYRLNNTNWINNNGTYVNVNPNNWVRTNGNAETNNAIRFMLENNGPINKIETFRRKTFRDI